MIRRSNNLALVALVTAILRLSFPVLAAGIPAMAEAQGWGHSNRLGLPLWLAILILDLAIHLQQVLFHAVPGCWRLHRMHHADLDFDATAGLRFHPVGILLPMIFRVAVIGAPAVAVLAFELILNATELFNQSNIAQPRGVDRVLRLVLVSPDLHRVHRSTEPRAANSNPGSSLRRWDCAFGSYIAQPAKGHQAMGFGINEFRTPRDLWLDRMPVQPLRGPASSHALDPGDGRRPDAAPPSNPAPPSPDDRS